MRKNNPEAARRLLKHGANINARDYQGDTPLHFAVEKGELDFINLLHEHGADLDAKNHIVRAGKPYAGCSEDFRPCARRAQSASCSVYSELLLSVRDAS